jgi:hypothetical protein
MPALLAIDLGLRSGLAYYTSDGRLRWYRSQNYGNRQRLRRAVDAILGEWPELTDLILEGGGDLAVIWQKQATRRQIAVQTISAEQWRADLLLDREQRRGLQAKDKADRLARRVIESSDAPRPTSLRHDAAEAILVGLWAVWKLGWLAELPRDLR